MADKRITDLQSLTSIASGDLFEVVDISDIADSAGGSSRKITYTNIMAGALTQLGITASVAELNILSGATLSTTELNYVDGVTSAIQTQINAKAPLASPTFTGTVTLPVGLTGVIRADSGVVSVDSDVTDIVAAASTTAAGKIEIAIASEVTTGTDATRAVSPDSLAGSTIFGVKVIEMQIVADATDVDTTSGIGYVRIPQAFTGMNLIRAQADVTTAGTTNATTIQVRNMTAHAANDSLSGAISIASGAVLGTAGTVDTLYDDVTTDDLIKIYVTGQSTTKPKGLRAWLEFQLP